MFVDLGSESAVVPVVPDRCLTRDRETGHWVATSERTAFDISLETVNGGKLPAGWYELSGRMSPLDDSQLFPNLIPTYVGGESDDSLIRLPAIGQDSFRTLVLMKYGVSGLKISPGLGASRFAVDALRLTRVSRFGALRRMLLGGQGGIVDKMRRAVLFVTTTCRRGLQAATSSLFSTYQIGFRPHTHTSYAIWVAEFDTLTSSRIQAMTCRATRIGRAGPLISILLPVYNTNERWLRRCIESALRQIYPNWQLCIADDASSDRRVAQVLEEYALRDPRIRIVRRESNGHISKASNSALEIAEGEFVALLDHDDELRPHALLEVAEAILESPDLVMVYSDEDKIDENGRRFDPYFKPDFDLDLLRSQNYICHLTVIRANVIREVGGFRPGYEGSQDHDLFLRCCEQHKPAQIKHIPRVLYHWRAIEGSTALSRDAKDYASAAGVRAVSDHLQRTGTAAQAEELSCGHYRVRWPLPKPRPLVSLIIPTRDRVELLRLCLESILNRSTYGNVEVLVVDNASSDPEALAYLESLEQQPRVRVLRYGAPFNYSAINNWAAAQATGSVIGLVNNDVEVITPDWLEEMVSHATREDVGAVGAMLYYPDNTIQHAGVILGVHGVAAHVYCGMPRGYPGHGGRARVVQHLSAVTGACLLVRRELFEKAGGLDEQLAVAFNDIDFCLRLDRLGYRNIWTPFAELYHHESASRGAEDTEQKRERFASEVELMRNRWGSTLMEDPAYNPNLSLNSLYFEFASNPRC